MQTYGCYTTRDLGPLAGKRAQFVPVVGHEKLVEPLERAGKLPSLAGLGTRENHVEGVMCAPRAAPVALEFHAVGHLGQRLASMSRAPGEPATAGSSGAAAV